jgi:hypothetical protein
VKLPDALSRKFAAILPLLDERARRLVVANEARSLGYGGVSEISRASGLSRKAISKGIRELADGVILPPGRIRRAGAGRKRITISNPKLLNAMARLIEPETRGDPESPLRWTCKSTRTVAKQLAMGGHSVSHVKVAQLLHDQGYSLQSNRKTEEGADHPDRDAQFRFINSRVKRALAAKTPVISVDTKKKELIGNFENGGQQWLPAKKPKKVNGHDFPHPDIPRAYPYGVYDLGLRVSQKPPDSNGTSGSSFPKPVADSDVVESAQSAHDGVSSGQLAGIPVQRPAESRKDDIRGGEAQGPFFCPRIVSGATSGWSSSSRRHSHGSKISSQRMVGVSRPSKVRSMTRQAMTVSIAMARASLAAL